MALYLALDTRAIWGHSFAYHNIDIVEQTRAWPINSNHQVSLGNDPIKSSCCESLMANVYLSKDFVILVGYSCFHLYKLVMDIMHWSLYYVQHVLQVSASFLLNCLPSSPYWDYATTSIIKSRHCNSFGDRVPVDEIYEYPISKWVTATWQGGQGIRIYCQRRPPNDMPQCSQYDV